jgi:hypothetical protein
VQIQHYFTNEIEHSVPLPAAGKPMCSLRRSSKVKRERRTDLNSASSLAVNFCPPNRYSSSTNSSLLQPQPKAKECQTVSGPKRQYEILTVPLQEKKIPTEAHPVSVASSSSSNLVWIPPCKTMKKDHHQ